MQGKLEELKVLRDSGHLNEDEYQALRREVLTAYTRSLGTPHPAAAGQPGHQKTCLPRDAGTELGTGNHRYRLLEWVGNGGVGEVWKVEDLAAQALTGQPEYKALKLLLPELADDPQSKQRLKHEALKNLQLAHEHLCRVHHWDEDPILGYVYIVMEWLEGEPKDGRATPAPSLRRHLIQADQTRSPFSLNQVLEWLAPIAQALDHAHGKKLIHRDIKPENILCAIQQAKPVMKLLDFGLAAEARDHASRMGSRPDLTPAAGYTPGYQAPETQAHHHPTPAQDIYSLAVVAYELLTLHLPYPAMRHPAAPEPLRPEGLNDAAWAGLLQGLAYKPQDRPATAQDFISRLRQKPLESPNILVPNRRVWTPGEVFRDAPFAPEMVVLPRGEFWMGSSERERKDFLAAGGKDEWFNQELPQHRVGIDYTLAIGKCAVTVGQWEEFLRRSGWQGGDSRWANPGFTQDDDHPVTCVSWDDAQAYLVWLNQELGLTDKAYRLPSEAEWEYACRAGTQGPYSFAGPITSEKANYNANYSYAGSPKGKYRAGTVAVGSLPANPWGLHEVHGNVWEWVEDGWHDDYKGAPMDGSAWSTGCTENRRVLRGGSWGNYPRYLRSANRNRYAPVNRINHAGFRPARTLP